MASVISGSLNMSFDIQSNTQDVNKRTWLLDALKTMVAWAPGAIYQVLCDTISIPASSNVQRTLTGASGGIWPSRSLADPADPSLVGKKVIAYAVKNGHSTDPLSILWLMGTLIVPPGQVMMAYRPAGVIVPSLSPTGITLTHSGGSTDMPVDIAIVYQ